MQGFTRPRGSMYGACQRKCVPLGKSEDVEYINILYIHTVGTYGVREGTSQPNRPGLNQLDSLGLSIDYPRDERVVRISSANQVIMSLTGAMHGMDDLWQGRGSHNDLNVS